MNDGPRKIDLYLDGLLDDAEIVDLMQWVGAEEANADLFAKHCLLDQHARELLADVACEPLTTKNKITDSIWVWLTPLAVAATVLIAIGMFMWQWRTGGGNTCPAVVAQSVGGFQADGIAVRPGDPAQVGIFRLERGIARLDFSNGAQVAIEGPASLEIVDDRHVVLQHGIATARVPESAHGFVVETTSTRVVDMGTAFGVSVNDDGITNVCVFEGEVEVNQRGSDSVNAAPQRVLEGQAIRAGSSSPTIESVDFDTRQFERAWPVNAGVLQTTGVMKFVSPGPGFAPGLFQDSKHIVVIPERRDVVLDSSLRIDVAEPGEYRRLPGRPSISLENGTRVRSYLLQLNPVGHKRTVAMGQITFDRPIVGLIASSGKLAQSDSVLGHPDGVYQESRRGVEPPRNESDEKPDRDTVIIAADNRTLILNLGAGTALDQIRVIVDDSLPPRPTLTP